MLQLALQLVLPTLLLLVEVLDLPGVDFLFFLLGPDLRLLLLQVLLQIPVLPHQQRQFFVQLLVLVLLFLNFGSLYFELLLFVGGGGVEAGESLGLDLVEELLVLEF